MLATRHLVREDGRLVPTHDRLRERIDTAGVVVDGIFISFDEFASMLQSYEGFQFDLAIVDPTDEV